MPSKQVRAGNSSVSAHRDVEAEQAGIDPLHLCSVGPKTRQIYLRWIRDFESEYPLSATADASMIDANLTTFLLKLFAAKAGAQKARHVFYVVKWKHALTNSHLPKAHFRIQGFARERRDRPQDPVA